METFFWVVVALWLILDLYVLFARNRDLRNIADWKSKFVIIASVSSGVTLAVIPEDFRLSWLVRERFTAVHHVGVVLMVGGITLRLLAIRTLGKYFTPDIALVEGQRIVTTGVYRFLRHPSYTGELLAFGGVALVFWHFPSSLYIFLFPLLGFLYRALLEERKLLEFFGEEYREYMRRTRRFI
ncbi:MAG: isoprenylcysteine carboxylmethyltransferase family protein [Candidatus Caldatribacterium sp.]|uniref:methyltransferase family protein n=1 Tax=Candidatus Caldatribacterium sp. TaxID=2282143 RepID=UPI00299A63E6|nr:isoprenylcysteine carboxylmethyltransferase family protein [Candidatus Caldatribacterium sp.]MCX7730028.1 isoprenylcysteine carboxylmethyltransferase family protein [Candidatus Caldatribacterium sp.]MDW8080965.1 isoprenylcysteine carboxylmethyltransferase family protein [Candidatus Calescibacterium sp.]